MTPSLSPELRLAATCAMWPPSDRRSGAILTAAAGTLDWPRFLRVVRRHQVVGLVHEGLNRAKVDVPREIGREIGAQAAILVHENLAIARESLRLQRLFDDAHLPVRFLKGVSLAMLAFHNLDLRAGKDIDLLISHETLPAATALLLRAGYRRFDPPPDITDAQLQIIMPLRKDLGFVHQATGLQIELHWRLFLNAHAVDEASTMAALRVVPLTGAAGLRTMGEEDLFAYLCMHGALHWWKSAQMAGRYQRPPGGRLRKQRGAPHPRCRSQRCGARRFPGSDALPADPRDARPRSSDGRACQKPYNALAGSNSVDCNDHRRARARTT